MAGNNFNEIILYEWRGGENVCCWEKSSFGLPLGQGQGPVYCSSASSPQEFLRWWWGCVYAANDENVYAAVSPHNSPPQLELLSQTQTGAIPPSWMVLFHPTNISFQPYQRLPFCLIWFVFQFITGNVISGNPSLPGTILPSRNVQLHIYGTILAVKLSKSDVVENSFGNKLTMK